MMKVYIFVIYVVLHWGTTNGVINSVEKLSTILKSEEQSFQNIKDLVAELRDELNLMKSYVETYETIKTQKMDHPVNAFKTIKALATEWRTIQDNTVNFMKVISKLQAISTAAPAPDDLERSASSIMTLQMTYEQEAELLSEGIIEDYESGKVFQSRQNLTAEDCKHFGEVAMGNNFFDLAIEWYETALLIIEKGDVTANEKEIWKLLDEALLQHDKVLDQYGPWGTFDTPFDPYLANQKKYKKGLVSRNFRVKLFQDQESHEEMRHAERLCRGEELRSEDWEQPLSCRYIRNNEPYLFLNPMKLEEHSLNPYIVMFHDFMSENEIQQVLNTANPQLEQSSFFSTDGINYDTGFTRTSENAWLSNEQMGDLVSRRIEMALNLNANHEAAEFYQVANYGIGGQYATHSDFLQDSPGFFETGMGMHMGDRMGTFLTYLSDVDAGGGTVFPRAGVAVKARKGSAVFWWNLYKDGYPDQNTRHAGCPVLHGSKWIANKWIRSNGQMFNAQCDVKQMKRFDENFWV